MVRAVRLRCACLLAVALVTALALAACGPSASNPENPKELVPAGQPPQLPAADVVRVLGAEREIQAACAAHRSTPKLRAAVRTLALVYRIDGPDARFEYAGIRTARTMRTVVTQAAIRLDRCGLHAQAAQLRRALQRR
jgi:hypothetical protein